MRRYARVSLLLVFVVSACGGSPSKPTPPAISGRWDGTIFSPTDAGGPITLQLSQSGSAVTGSVHLFQNGTDTPATLSGTIGRSSSTLLYTVTYTYSDGCQGTFSGTATVMGNDMHGEYTGHNCTRDFVGTLDATRSN